MRLINFCIKILPSNPVYAHCDIPCGMYDPTAARMAAATVLKMVQKLQELKKPEGDDWLEYKNSMTRMIMTKETHAELCKKEVLILWTDYFKAEHLEKFPDLHDLIWKTTKLCSENKREISEEKARELIASVNKVAEIFEETHK